MKRCCECGLCKPIGDFHKSKKHPQGASPRCRSCAVKVASAWYVANKDRKRAYDTKRREEKRPLYRAASRRNRKKNPGKKNADTQARRAAFAKRMPPWVTKDDCSAFYEMAARVSRCLGIPHHVDHIVPLRGRLVSGLHVPLNLRVIPASVNVAKGNRYPLDGVR